MSEPTLAVTRLYMEDDRIADQNSPDRERYGPTWPDIESAIRRLDGAHRSIVILGKDDPEIDFMGIGGGADGVYRCFVVTEDGREAALLNPHEPGTEVREVFMGQLTAVSAQECLSLEIVLEAARTYAQTSQMHPALTWAIR